MLKSVTRITASAAAATTLPAVERRTDVTLEDTFRRLCTGRAPATSSSAAYAVLGLSALLLEHGVLGCCNGVTRSRAPSCSRCCDPACTSRLSDSTDLLLLRVFGVDMWVETVPLRATLQPGPVSCQSVRRERASALLGSRQHDAVCHCDRHSFDSSRSSSRSRSGQQSTEPRVSSVSPALPASQKEDM